MPSIIPTITINGVSSTTISGLLITSLPPIRKPAMRAVSEEIDGRDGDQITKLGFQAYDKTITIALAGTYDVDAVIKYFNQDGIITFSNEPEKYYRFKQLEGIDFEKLIRFKTAQVVFHCQPFKFSTTEAEKIFINPDEVSITNSGNIESKPEIVLRGKGSIEMSINENPVLAIDFGDEEQTIAIDSEGMNAYGTKNNIKEGTFSINPVQDLHGYENAWLESDDVFKTPYLFTKTAGTSSRIGNSMIDKIVGGSFAWNQIIPTANKDFTNTQTDTKTFLQIQIVSWESPVQLYGMYNYTQAANTCALLKPSTVTNGLRIKHNGSQLDMNLYRNVDVSLTANHVYIFNIDVESANPTTPGGIVTKNLMIIDLTQMFGSTIADYIYSLEQATAGAGVSWFRNLFPNDYYAYDAGSLKSVKTTAHVTTGFNQWDEAWELGSINTTTGNKTAVANTIRAKNNIAVLPNTIYNFTKNFNTQCFILFYDQNDNVLQYVKKTGDSAMVYNASCLIGVNSQHETFTPPDNCAYMLFRMDDKANYSSGVCINISDASLNGTYKAYEEHNYPLDDVELRGIPQLDANNNLFYDGDEYSSDGRVLRKYGIVDLDSLTFTYDESAKWLQSYVIPDSYSSVSAGMPHAVSDMQSTLVDRQALGIVDSGYTIYYGRVYVKNTALTEAQLRALISGKYLIYEKATATTETADAFASPQIVDASGSMEYVDARAVKIPVGHVSMYANNCEILGFTESNVSKSNKNLFDDDFSHYRKPVNYYICDIPLEIGKTYTLKAQLKGSSISGCYVGIANKGEQYYEFETMLPCINTTGTALPATTFTPSATWKSPKLIVYCADESQFNSLFENYEIQLELGSEATEFVEHVGKTIPVAWAVNQWDEEWESGTININGNLDDATKIRSKNFINVSGGHEYYIKSPSTLTFWGYDENQNVIPEVWAGWNTKQAMNSVIKIPEAVKYIRFYMTGTSYAGDISINSPASDHNYHAYSGIPTAYKAQLIFLDGTWELRLLSELIDLSSLTWRKITHGNVDMFASNDIANRKAGSNEMYCSIFPVMEGTRDALITHNNALATYNATNSTQIAIRCDHFTDATDFKSAMNGLILLYEREIPLDISLTADELISLLGINNIWHDANGESSILFTKDGDVEHVASGDIATFYIDVDDLVFGVFKNRLIIGDYDKIRLKTGSNSISFSPIEEGSEISELGVFLYSRWL